MRVRIVATAAAVLLALAAAVLAVVTPANAAAGFTVSGGRLLDANGNPFVMRGVNHAAHLVPDADQLASPTSRRSAPTPSGSCCSGGRWTGEQRRRRRQRHRAVQGRTG